MGASDYVAEEVSHDDAGGRAGSRRFRHSLQVGQRIMSLAKIVSKQISRRESRWLWNMEEVEEEEGEEELWSEKRSERIEGLAELLYSATETRKEDEVFRKEVIRQMVKIIENAIEIASAPGNKKIQLERLLLGLDGVIEQQIYRAAFQISTRRWVRTEEGDVVSLKRESQTAADHEVAKLKEELEITKVCLSSANERCTQLEEENRLLKDGDLERENRLLRESKEKRCAELEQEIKLLSESKEKRCAELEKEIRLLNESKEKRCAELEIRLLLESKEKRCAELEQEIKLLRASKDKRCAELEKEIGLLRASKDKRCAELEKEIRLLRGSRQRDGDLEREETSTTAAPTGANRSATTKKLKQGIELSEPATSFAVGGLVTLFLFHLESKSEEPQTVVFKAFKFCILATFACGMSISLLTIYAFSASYQMPIIKVLFYETKGFLLLSGVCVCIAFMKAIALLAFVPVIVEVIIVCIIVYYKQTVSSGLPLP